MKRLFSLLALFLLAALPAFAADPHARPEFLEKADKFAEVEASKGITDLWQKITFRAGEDPFLVVASIIFLLAILHTFVAVPITKYAHHVDHEHKARLKREAKAAHRHPNAVEKVSFKATILHFLGEVEAIFGIWTLALLAAMIGFYGMGSTTAYISNTVVFTEPLFVVVIMALASTRPVVRFAEKCLSLFAGIGGKSPAAWWLSILIIAPVLGSFITEPGAMTIAAMLLARKFYKLKPSHTFAYATLGLLFVNISIGGVLTNFAAPPVLMVAQKWDITSLYMFLHFGDKAVLAIIVSTLCYYLFFRKELKAMSNIIHDEDGDGQSDWHERTDKVPFFVTLAHLGFMAWTVAFAHHPPFFIGGFLFFLAFSKATHHHQNPVDLKGPIMVGFFLGGLVIHGGLQGWWLGPIISSLSEWPLFIGSTILTSFNDNAAITFLASQVPNLDNSLKYAVLCGAVTGGGLTVIANAPNPAGQAILGRFFGAGVSPLKLALAALIPTLITAAAFMAIPDPTAHENMGKKKSPPAATTP